MKPNIFKVEHVFQVEVCHHDITKQHKNTYGKYSCDPYFTENVRSYVFFSGVSFSQCISLVDQNPCIHYLKLLPCQKIFWVNFKNA